VNALLGVEHRRLGREASAPEAPPQPQNPDQAQPQQAQPQPRLADFLIRKLGEGGTMSRDDLRQLAVQEGYFAGSDGAEPALQETLTQIVKAGFIRHLPNGNFTAQSLKEMIGLRRAV
jgi:hypothetical protein